AGFFLLFLISRTSIFDLVREAGASFFAAAIGGYLVLLLMGMLFLGHGHPLRSRLRFFPLLATLWFSGYGIFLYSDQPLVLLLLMILLPVLTWMWLENLYLFLQRPFAYQ